MSTGGQVEREPQRDVSYIPSALVGKIEGFQMTQQQDPVWVRDNLLKTHLAEYSALRSEISSFHAIEHMAISFAIAAFSAVIGLVIKTGVPLDLLIRDHASYQLHVALIAFPFLLLGFFFGYSQIRIIQVAAYLNLSLRPQIVRDLGEAVLGWESYRRSSDCPQDKLSTLLSWSRWLLFVWPLGLLIWDAEWSWAPGPMDRLLYVEIIGFALLVWFGVYCSRSLPNKVILSNVGADAPSTLPPAAP